MRSLQRVLGTLAVSSLAALALAGCDAADVPELAASANRAPLAASRPATPVTTPQATTPPVTPPPTTPSSSAATTPAPAPQVAAAASNPAAGGSDTSSSSTTPPAGSSTADASRTTPPGETSRSSSASPTPSPTPPPTSTPRSAPAVGGDVAAQVLERVNAERTRVGCDPVRLDDRLTDAAERHSRDMAEEDFVEHEGSDGSTFVQRIRAEGYPSPRSENIAAGQETADAVMRAWLDSPGHRRNILDCTAQDMGLARAEADTRLGVYWTQVFGTG